VKIRRISGPGFWQRSISKSLTSKGGSHVQELYLSRGDCFTTRPNGLYGNGFRRDERRKRSKAAEKIKQKVTKIGTGEDARITVGLKNQKSLKGYVSEVGGDSFVVTNFKTKETTTIAYRDVAYVQGKGTSGARVALYIGIGAAAVIGALLIVYAAMGGD
jgi:hypothetical protein